MIPSVSGFMEQEPEISRQPTRTYRINRDTGHIRGYTEDKEAVRQAIYKILLTERYQYVMYSGDYGTETLDLYGQPLSYICPELERRITEALICDDRIEGAEDFNFSFSEKGTLLVTFTVRTIFGEIDAEKKMEI